MLIFLRILKNDGVQEVLFFSADQMKSLSASAALYSYKGDKQTLLGETRVDGHASAYRKLQVGKGRRQAGGVCGRGKIRWGVYAHRADLLERLL